MRALSWLYPSCSSAAHTQRLPQPLFTHIPLRSPPWPGTGTTSLLHPLLSPHSPRLRADPSAAACPSLALAVSDTTSGGHQFASPESYLQRRHTQGLFSGLPLQPHSILQTFPHFSYYTLCHSPAGTTAHQRWSSFLPFPRHQPPAGPRLTLGISDTQQSISVCAVSVKRLAPRAQHRHGNDAILIPSGGIPAEHWCVCEHVARGHGLHTHSRPSPSFTPLFRNQRRP